MNLSICSFASSSSGNSYLIKSDETAILVDAGVSAKAIDAALATQGLGYEDLGAICVTHEHIDHIKCLHTLMKRRPFRNPVFASGGTRDAALEKTSAISAAGFERVQGGDIFTIKDIKITTFGLSHDAAEPVGYSFEKNGRKIAIVTDTGCMTEDIFRAIKGADALVIEANHEKNLLLYGRYPYSLKRRILSDVGHLSNEDCGGALCRFLREIDGEKVPRVVLAHLSSENNTPTQALLTVRNILEENDFCAGRDFVLSVAPKAEVGEIIKAQKTGEK